jgi:hypothetical protein
MKYDELALLVGRNDHMPFPPVRIGMMLSCERLDAIENE